MHPSETPKGKAVEQAVQAEMTNIFAATDAIATELGLDFNKDEVQKQCALNGQRAGEELLEKITPDESTLAAMIPKIVPGIRIAMLNTLRMYVSVETFRKVLLALSGASGGALSVATAEQMVEHAERSFFTLGKRIAYAVEARAINPVIKRFGTQAFQVVRIGPRIFAREVIVNSAGVPLVARMATLGSKSARVIGPAAQVAGAGLAFYDAYLAMVAYKGETVSLAQILESEGATGIADSMSSIVQHGENQYAANDAKDREILQTALNEQDTQKKLVKAHDVVAEIHGGIVAFNVSAAPANRGWVERAGNWAARPTEWMCEQLLGNPDEIRIQEQRSQLDTLATGADKILEQLKQLPSTEVISATIVALETAVNLAREVSRTGVTCERSKAAELSQKLADAQKIFRDASQAGIRVAQPEQIIRRQ